MNPESVQNLKIWQEGIEVVKDVYRLSKEWPREELYGLVNQARRAAVSTPANIAEGRGRRSSGEQARFASIALGSAYELQTLLHLANELEFGSRDSLESLQSRLHMLIKQIARFVAALEKRL
ncbi:four helix bundle protein [Meiothermus sp.]|uniref:four helix bundle protein n=1 Tax=Meiothermus sp. TaxID=1955249 RepID=UPI0021DF2BF5|nr:four helix bundle protein [Meiothermus sp.]GIW25880.1 MAG: hypothetical protein KatS3mg069_2147 [Meiothermus sp.]